MGLERNSCLRSSIDHIYRPLIGIFNQKASDEKTSINLTPNNTRRSRQANSSHQPKVLPALAKDLIHLSQQRHFLNP